MAKELSVTYVAENSAYCIIRRTSDGNAWTAGGFTPWVDANISDYDIPLTDFGGDLWVGDAPNDLVNGVEYIFTYYEQKGAAPTTTDLLLSAEEGVWNGVELDITAATCTDGSTYFNLACIVPWTRRRASDIVKRTRETHESDGTDAIAVDNEGDIKLITLDNDGSTVDIDTITIFENWLKFPAVVTDGNTIIVEYTHSKYSDLEMLEYLEDAATQVSADLGKLWLVNSTTHQLENLNDTMFDDNGQFSYLLQKLIVMGSALAIFSDKASNLTGDAIKVRDGDTFIDTAAAGSGQTKLLDRLVDQYNMHMTDARSRCFRGMAIRGDIDSKEELVVASDAADE